MHKLFIVLLASTLLLSLLLSTEVVQAGDYAQKQYGKNDQGKYAQRNYYSEQNYYSQATYYAEASYGGGGSSGGSNNPGGGNGGGSSGNNYIPCPAGQTNCEMRTIYPDDPNYDYIVGNTTCTRSQPPSCLVTTPSAYTQTSYGGTQSTYGSGNQAGGQVTILTFADLDGDGIKDTFEPGIGSIGLAIVGGLPPPTDKKTETAPNGSGQFSGLQNNTQYTLTVSGYGAGLSLTGSNPRSITVSSGTNGKFSNTGGLDNQNTPPSPSQAPTTPSNPFQSFMDWLYGVFGR